MVVCLSGWVAGRLEAKPYANELLIYISFNLTAISLIFSLCNFVVTRDDGSPNDAYIISVFTFCVDYVSQ